MRIITGIATLLFLIIPGSIALLFLYVLIRLIVVMLTNKESECKDDLI